MRRDHLTGLAIVMLALLTAVPAAAQSGDSWSVPRTADGRPDIGGVWANNTATPLERPDVFADRDRITDEELAELRTRAAEVLDGEDAFFGDDFIAAALSDDKQFRSFDTDTGNYNQFWLSDREIDNRTSLITDPPSGKLPPMTPEGQARAMAQLQQFADERPLGPADLPLNVRCITYGLPNLLAGYNSYFQIVQTSGHVAIVQELIHDVRIIPLDGRPHLADGVRQWHGDPRGYWDGDTLVVETTNFSPQSDFRGAKQHLRLVERFTRVGPETLHYEIQIEDPTTWTSPWTALIPLKYSEDAIFEYACHEGNYGMEGILAGARAEERREASASSAARED